MRTTVRLPEDLMRQVRKKAAEEGRTLTSLIDEALRTLLAEPKTSRRVRVRLPVSKAKGGTQPGVDLNRSCELLDLMESR